MKLASASALLYGALSVNAFGLNLPQFNGFSGLQQTPFNPLSALQRPREAEPMLVAMQTWDQTTSMAALPEYQLRVKEPKVCDTSVQQYSGYLDVDTDKHFFFWFFEARNGKKDAPLILWLNGGPGCSSMTGLLMELGPCRVTPDGNGTVTNENSWNNEAHIIFLDQPLNVGYSYGSNVFNSIDAGKDINAFLQLFLETFPEYEKSPLHVFGESYGGHYVPAAGKAIHESNKAREQKREMGIMSVEESKLRKLPLASIGVGNGLVDPLIQYKYYSKMTCNSTYPPVLDQIECDAMDRQYPTCARMIEACYKYENRLACIPPEYYCNNMLGAYTKSGRNPYDVRVPCEGELCYPIIGSISKYLNNPKILKELGSEVSKFESCSTSVYSGFILSGDWMKPYMNEIPPLLEDKIPVLIYAGDADWICNWYGNKAWSLELPWEGKADFNAAKDLPWKNGNKDAGEVRSHGPFTFLRVFGAGHMVPYDQGPNALDMINRWISGKSFSD
ncbi:hypothetical protein H4219_000333 [Mycoemilia scoparia]|uniref:Carboxypeptidase n=1 Tax=Mycoemilia scoparia TaxID=417184 RepID=A0A9W8DWV0_9FUNG|nr:hypothetical protein H4219_000333 [Mycoemilia scoparia]